uniref:Uncharacterized protein n=1 Tax=Rhizophora mucronata TaxID=61149 RepID=A0A2P2NX34_RHIMU
MPKSSQVKTSRSSQPIILMGFYPSKAIQIQKIKLRMNS